MLAILFDLTRVSFYGRKKEKKKKKKKEKKKECLYVRPRDRKELDCMKKKKSFSTI